MPKSAPLQSDFTSGEISPYAQGRVDQPWYKKSMAVCFNGFPMIQGGWTRRGGTKFLAQIFGAGGRLIPFAPKYGSNCMMVMGTNKLYCFQNYVLVSTLDLSGSLTYGTSELSQVRYVQNGSYIYFFHPNHPPLYAGDTAGAGYPNVVGFLNFIDGPYSNSNIDANGYTVNSTTMTLGSHTPGTTTLTASSTAGINGGAGFQASDIGRVVRLNPTATTPGTGVWCWCRITAVTSTTLVTVFLYTDPGSVGTGASLYYWTLGLYTLQAGHQPSCGTIYAGRLYLGAGSGAFPRRFDASSLEYDITIDAVNIHFNPSDLNLGLVTDSSGLDFTLASRDSQNTCWMEGDEHGVLMGTTGDEWTIRPSSLSEALTATNVDAKASTYYGSNPTVAPCKVGKSLIFVQRSSLKVRELYYSFDVSGYRAPDRTKWAEHVTQPTGPILSGVSNFTGITEMAHQREPQSIMWAAKADGTLCALTHEEEDGEITAGWHRHALGANPDSGSGAGVAAVFSVAVLPSSDGTRDEVWLLTGRSTTPMGSLSYYVETLQPSSNGFITDTKQWFLDFATQKVNGSPTATITGLSLYNGTTVTVWADGAPYGQFAVSGGQIVLPQAVTTCLVGYDYNSDGQLNRMESGSADGAALTKIRRMHRVGLVLQQTLSLAIGTSFTNLTPLNFRTQDTGLGLAQPSFSGIKLETIDADYSYQDQFTWRANGGAPCTILAVCPRMDTQDAD